MPTIDAASAWYPTDDPVHGFDHVLRVYFMADLLAQAEGADKEIVLAAVLLHDAYSNLSVQSNSQNGALIDAAKERQSHHHASAEFARQVLEAEGWNEGRIQAVEHCIRAHRFRDDSEQPQTLEAQVLFDADKLDAIGAIGVARAIAYATRQGMPAYAPVSDLFRQTGKLQPGELHSAYHEFVFKLVRLKDRLYTSSGREQGELRHRELIAFFSQLSREATGGQFAIEPPPNVVNWAPVGAGKLAIHHRPKLSKFSQLRQEGCHTVVTLLSEREGAANIQRAVQANGMEWIWLPLEGGDYPTGEAHERLLAALPVLSHRLDNGKGILIHCSAGIHRTGMLAYALLRWRGVSGPDALKLIEQMRSHTAAGLLTKQIAWGEDIAASIAADQTTSSLESKKSGGVPLDAP